MNATFMTRLQYWWREGDYPLTKWIILLNVVTFVVGIFVPLGSWLAFLAPSSLLRPWTLFTYPLLSSEPLNLLFYGLLMWFVGGSLERSWGTKFFATYFAAMAAITAASFSVAALIYNAEFAVANYLPLAALFVAWCMLNPDQEIRLWGIIPVLAKWLALGEVLIIFFTHSSRVFPLLGFFALAGCAASFWWVRNRSWSSVSLYSSTPFTPRASKPKKKPRNRRDDDFSIRDLNPLERIARAKRRKQFARLIEDDKTDKTSKPK